MSDAQIFRIKLHSWFDFFFRVFGREWDEDVDEEEDRVEQMDFK